MWPQWSFQPWPPLWIVHSRVTGHYVQSEPCVTTWTGPQISGRIRVSACVLQKKGFDKDISPATISSWIKQTVMSSLTSRLSLYIRLKPACQILSACHWKSHNTFTQFYLKDVAWADSELFHLGPVVAAQQVHQQTQY